uniref:PX domain containing serine/threonine kinase n=1 Tax=Sphaeramia orbicularis TaxID=375764 RepID=A0A673AE09_9TELE
MSLSEKPAPAVIEASQNLQSHTEYIIRVQRGVSVENSWQVIRRYSDFDVLNSSLLVCGVSLPLPPKKLIGNMDREFIAERQRGLQLYLDSITQHPLLCSSLSVKKFLDPNNYSANYTEIALQQVSMFFRSDPKWEVVEPLRDMGWRIRKKYFMIKNKEQPKDRHLLTWVSQHTHTLCVSDHIYDQSCGTWEQPSGVPCVFQVKPRDIYLKKYYNPKKSQGLDLPLIKLYGRQILEALKQLHDGGLYFGHLNTCNVIIDDGVCRLTDVENGPLGVPSVLRPFFTQLRKINTTESIDVFCFGHLLYEMTYGLPPDSVPIDQYTDIPYTTVVSVLQSILSTEACKMLFLKLHQHRRLTRAQSHHGSEEERKRRKILARKKSRQYAYENEEDISVRNNNNSGRSPHSNQPHIFHYCHA